MFDRTKMEESAKIEKCQKRHLECFCICIVICIKEKSPSLMILSIKINSGINYKNGRMLSKLIHFYFDRQANFFLLASLPEESISFFRFPLVWDFSGARFSLDVHSRV